MNQEAVTFMNWYGLLLLLPATVILAWKLVTEKLRENRISLDLKAVAWLMLWVIIALTEMNVDNSTSRLSWPLRIVQLIVLLFFYKSLWPLWKQRLRD